LAVSQIQVLNRTQPGLPLRKGRCGNPGPRPQAVGNRHAVCAADAAERWLSLASTIPPALQPHQFVWLNLVERWFREITEKRLAPIAGAVFAAMLYIVFIGGIVE